MSFNKKNYLYNQFFCGGGNWVKSKKILFSLILILSICINIFGQSNTNTVNNNSSTSSVSEGNQNSVRTGFDENSTDYFSFDNRTSTSENTNNSTVNSNRRNTSTGWLFFRMIIVLILVCAAIYFIFWLLKKKNKVGITENEYLRRAAFINIAPNKTIEVITLIDKAYLIGVTESNISLIGEITDKELIQSMNLTADKKQNVKNPVNFAEVLDMFTRKSKNSNAFSSAENNLDSLIKTSENSEENKSQE